MSDRILIANTYVQPRISRKKGENIDPLWARFDEKRHKFVFHSKSYTWANLRSLFIFWVRPLSPSVLEIFCINKKLTSYATFAFMHILTNLQTAWSCQYAIVYVNDISVRNGKKSKECQAIYVRALQSWWVRSKSVQVLPPK